MVECLLLMSDSLRKKSITSVIWNSLEKFVTLAIQTICGLIVAHFVAPEEFGLVGMITIFISICQVLTDSGFSQSLIRKKDVTEDDYSTIFYFNIVVGLVLYLLLFALAPLIASFYEMPKLTEISRWAFLVIPINSLGFTQNSILMRDINFKVLSRIGIFSAMCSAITGVLASFLLQNVWALVIQNLVLFSSKVCFLWLNNPWRPTKGFSLEVLKSHLGFSLSILGTGLLNSIFNNLYGLLIGKFFRAKELGLYSQAEKLQNIPSGTLTDVVGRILFPILSKIQDDDERLRRVYKKVIGMTFYLTAPVMFFCILQGTNIFDVILPEKWQRAALYFQILSVHGLLYPLQAINVNILLAKGYSKQSFYLEFVRKILMLTFLFGAIPFGIIGVVVGKVVYAVCSLFINMYFCGRPIKLSVGSQMLQILPVILLCLVSFVPLTYLFSLFDITAFVQLLLVFCSSTFLYLLLSYLMKVEAMVEILAIITQKLKRNVRI